MSIDEIALTIAQGNKEQAEIYSYVLKSKLHSWGTLALAFLVSYILGVLPYALIITYSIMLLRINSGGAHSKTLKTCSISSIIVVNILALVVSYITVSKLSLMYYMIFLAVSGLYLITRYVPLDSPQRPIVNPQFRKQLKTRSYIVFLLIITCFYTLYIKGYHDYGFAILLGLSWQLFTMSKLGYWTISKIDSLF